MSQIVADLDTRHQKYKKYRLSGMTIYESAVKAGYSESYARGTACRMDRRIRRDMQHVFARRGLTDDALAKHAMEGLNATKVISANVSSPDGSGMSDAHGTTKDFIEVPDWPTRHRYFDSICAMTNRTGKTAVPVSFNEYKIIIVRAEIPNEVKTISNVIEIERPLIGNSAERTLP